MYRVVVSLGFGSLETGFESISVTLIDLDGNPLLKRVGTLPSHPELAGLYHQWKQLYRGYYSNVNHLPYRLEFLPEDEDPYEFSELNFKTCCDRLQAALEDWLTYAGWAQIFNRLRTRLHHRQSFQWVLESADPVVQHLPWHLWSFFQDYPQAEVAISLPEFEKIVPSQNKPRQHLKILVILGKTVNDLGDEINVEADRQIIESIPQVSATFVNQTNRTELSDLLWEQDWDVILFAGHSSSSGPSRDAGFLLNSDTSQNFITIQDLELAFRAAIKRGLKLVIFNSCDSFELGLDLMRLNLPQCIAMREAIPDAVAQRFLRYLIQQWYEHDSFIVAVRQARARLKESEDPRFPCASWLPVICQNPAVLPPTWPVTEDAAAAPSTKSRSRQPRPLLQCIAGGIGWSTVLLGIRALGGLQSLELKAFDQFHRLRPAESVDENVLLITISDADIQYQDQQQMPRRGSLSDVALDQLLAKLKPLKPRAVAVDIFHDFAYEPQVKRTIQTFPNFISICEVGFSSDQSGSIAPPPSVPFQTVGFSDVLLDHDNHIRRQLLRMRPSKACPSDYGLGLRLAEVYLGKAAQGPDQQGNLFLGSIQLPRVSTNAGGYSLPAREATGYQIMTRYRRSQFHHLSLREVLTGTSMKFQEYARDRLILIGLKQRNRDSLYTPTDLNPQGKLTGMEIHAHMASQLIQAVEQGRALMWWWPEWLESLWIGLWMLAGVMVLYFIQKRWIAVGLLMGAIAIATLVCYSLFLVGGWIPWVPVVLGLVTIAIGGVAQLGLNRIKAQATSQHRESSSNASWRQTG